MQLWKRAATMSARKRPTSKKPLIESGRKWLKRLSKEVVLLQGFILVLGLSRPNWVPVCPAQGLKQVGQLPGSLAFKSFQIFSSRFHSSTVVHQLWATRVLALSHPHSYIVSSPEHPWLCGLGFFLPVFCSPLVLPSLGCWGVLVNPCPPRSQSPTKSTSSTVSDFLKMQVVKLFFWGLFLFNWGVFKWKWWTIHFLY